MKWTAIALLGINLLLGITLALRGDPEPPQTRFPESDAPAIVLLAEMPPEPTPQAPPQTTPTSTAPSSPHELAPSASTAHGDDHGGEETPPAPPAAAPHLGREPVPPAKENQPQPPANTESRDVALSEATTALAEAEPPPLPELKPPPLHDYCYRIGPVGDKKTLTVLRNRLQRHLGTRGRSESRKVPVKVGYWVYLPPQPLPKAEATVRTLRKKGVQDLYLLREGDNRGAISLGLYKQKRFAERRRRQLAEMGIQAQLGPRHKPGYRYWVNIEIRAEKPPGRSTWRAIEKGLKGVTHRRRDCA